MVSTKARFQHQVGGEITRDLQERSRALLLIRNTLYAHEGSDRYVATFLMNADDTAGFLKSKLSANWQQHLKDFAGHAASIAAQARDANVPLAAVFVPDRAQAIMISDNVWPAGYDPYKLDGEVRTILSSHGATYIDILPKFRNLIRPEEAYFSGRRPSGCRRACNPIGASCRRLTGRSAMPTYSCRAASEGNGARRIVMDTASFQFVLFGLAVALVSRLQPFASLALGSSYGGQHYISCPAGS